MRIKSSTHQSFANKAQHMQNVEKVGLAETPSTQQWSEGAMLLQAPFMPKGLNASSLG